MPASWILAVEATGVERDALRAAMAAAAGPLGDVDVEDRGEAFVLAVPTSSGVHPAAVAVLFPAALDEAVSGLSGHVRLVIDHDSTPDRALDLAAVLRGSAADPALLVALTEHAWQALSQGANPVPLRGFQRITIYHATPPRVAWLRYPDDDRHVPATPAAEDDPDVVTGPPFLYGDAPTGPNFGPPPGPDFPTDR